MHTHRRSLLVYYMRYTIKLVSFPISGQTQIQTRAETRSGSFSIGILVHLVSLGRILNHISLSISPPSVCEIHATQFLSYPTFLLWFSVPKIQFPLFLLFQDSVIPWNPFQSFVQRLLLGTPSSLVVGIPTVTVSLSL